MAGMSGHTPGPWRLIPRDAANRPPAVQRGAQGGFVVNGLDAAAEDADARLVAAAPLMIAALNKAKSAMDHVWGVKENTDDDWIYDEMGCELSGAYFEARAAIAAATGENA